MKPLAPIVALCLALVFPACAGNDSSPGSARSDTTTAKSKPEAPRPIKPKVEVPKGPPPKKLAAEDLKTGSGPAAEAGDDVTVHYVGVEYKNGKQIDSSWDRGEPFTFQLGGGTVIPGWEEGVPGMKVGGRRELIVPSKLAYGSGALIFVIDLVRIGGSTDTSRTGNGLSKPEIKVPEGPPPKELMIKDLKEGSGTTVEVGDDIVVDYVGFNYKTGEEFESTWERSEPAKFRLDPGEVIEGWEEGVPGMKVGGRRELIVPSRLAYETGPLIYVIDLVDVK